MSSQEAIDNSSDTFTVDSPPHGAPNFLQFTSGFADHLIVPCKSCLSYDQLKWIKDITPRRGQGEFYSYPCKNDLEIFELHWPRRANPGKPQMGEILALKQHGKITHLVTPISNLIIHDDGNRAYPHGREVLCLRSLDADKARSLRELSDESLCRTVNRYRFPIIDGMELASLVEGASGGSFELLLLQRKIWSSFFASDDPFCPGTHSAVHEGGESAHWAIEGELAFALQLHRKREAKLTREAKEQSLAEKGRLLCEVCEFDFSKKYGDLGADFIEGHHRLALSELPGATSMGIEDLALVCSNCHSMLHRKCSTQDQWLTVDELRALIGVVNTQHETEVHA